MATLESAPKGRASELAARHSSPRFLASVLRRYWDSDGPSHTRGLAYHTILALLAGFIGFLGLASVIDSESLRGTAQEMVIGLSPGPSGQVLREAAHRGATGGSAAMVAGFGAALVAGTKGMRQVERAANRLFGIEKDRPVLRRWGVALALSLSAGTMLALGGLAVAGGEAIARGAGLEDTAWSIVRWPLGFGIVGLALALVYWFAPRKRPGTLQHLMAGVATALGLWVAFTGLLVLYFSVSDKTTQTYGPLVGIVALLLWSALTSLATILGLAVTAEIAGVSVDASRRSTQLG